MPPFNASVINTRIVTNKHDHPGSVLTEVLQVLGNRTLFALRRYDPFPGSKKSDDKKNDTCNGEKTHHGFKPRCFIPMSGYQIPVEATIPV